MSTAKKRMVFIESSSKLVSKFNLLRIQVYSAIIHGKTILHDSYLGYTLQQQEPDERSVDL
jgi:hypothetical protein